MDQNLMEQELSDNELEQVIGAGGHWGHHCQPKHPKYGHGHGYPHYDPKSGYPHEWHHDELLRCHLHLGLHLGI